MSWKELTKDFLHYLKLERGLSDNTISSYERDLVKFSAWADENNIKAIYATGTDLRKGVQHFSEEGLAQSSQSRLVSTIRAFYKFLLFENYVDEDPSEQIVSPKISRKLPDIISENEISKIIDAIDLSEEQGERNRAILEVLYGCGLRVSELTNLRISDLFFDQNLIRIIGKGNKERIVPINSEAQKCIRIYKDEVRVFQNILKGEEDILFLNRRGKRLTRAMIFTIVRTLTEKAGIRKKVSPHTFRHSFASHMVNRGADIRIVQDLLGHSSITTTEIYTHLDQRKIREAFEHFHPRSQV